MADTITWTPIDETTNFQDDKFYAVDFETKKVQVIIDQPIVAGENLSQFIKFQAGRYYDNIDLTEMDVNIIYESPTGYRDVSAAVNKECTDEYIRFGWLVPFLACPEPGTLSFSLEFAGVNYVLKTVTSTTKVLESISGSSSVPESEQSWYISLKEQMRETLETAVNAVNKAENILNALSSPRPAATAVDMIDTDVIYVYTGEDYDDYTYGYWYYYDPVAEKWKPGGVYASTAILVDETLTVPGRAAEALAVREAIDAASEEAADALTTAVTNLQTQATADHTRLQSQISQLSSDAETAMHSEEIRSIIKLTRAEYDGITVKDPETLYIVQDD